jgi:hypothetical protein
MRSRLAAIATDRPLHAVMLTAGLLFGALMLLVGLPLARSSPYPSAREEGWTLASASSVVPKSKLERASQRAADGLRAIAWQALTAPMGGLAQPGPLLALRIPDPVWEDDSAATAERASAAGETSIRLTSIAPSPTRPKLTSAELDDVEQYLWEVYQRAPIKRDSSGDFSWKDQAAAKRLGISLPAYVIGGMDPDFREQLYHAGHAMDAAGIRWSMLSAFRDDWRQQIASGFKAHTGNSLHGGSRATGGYGHGRAVDVMNAGGDDEQVWHWVDAHGAKYGLRRPMPGADPAHIQAGGDWHRTAIALRQGRPNEGGTGEGFSLASANEKPPPRYARTFHHRHGHRHS